MTDGEVLFGSLALVAIGGLWVTGWIGIRDAGGYPDTWRHFLPGFYRWPWDKAWHAVSALLATLAGVTLFDGRAIVIALIVAVGGVAVEAAEKWPSDATRGRCSEKDLFANALGILLALAIASAL